MATLLHCPREVIDAVLELLTVAELSALCLTHGALRILAEPYLYAKVEWTWKDFKKTPPPIRFLLETLLRRPELSLHVRSLVVRGAHYGSFSGFLPKLTISLSELPRVVNFIQSTAVPFVDLWETEARRGTIDAYFAALVAQLPNLTHLFIGKNIARESTLFGMMLRSALFHPVNHRLPQFKQLQRVTFRRTYEHSLHVVDPADALSLFYLPAVKHLSVSIENPTTVSAWPAYTPDVSNITSLSINMLREPHLASILRETKSLKKLNYKWNYDPQLRRSNPFMTPVINLGQVADALSFVGGTLTDLTLRASCELEGIVYPSLEMQGSLKSITERLDKVTRLQAPWAFLVQLSPEPEARLEDAMPASVEHVIISEDLWRLECNELDHDDVLDLIKLWLNQGMGSTPCLTRISLGFAELSRWLSRKMHPKVADLCAPFGIEGEALTIRNEDE
ncbi:hypothetical protein NM208_g346 [Fusarium decemcellulare]|uniref:Uncharacterized protein n=1 Tax=Fusarium decemcellulare TaxID=57161 RepID=A0ACC1SZY2_9HYPO|nr:hypothetical protein NM208_g346 [Fusarium decemcellulare]